MLIISKISSNTETLFIKFVLVQERCASCAIMASCVLFVSLSLTYVSSFSIQVQWHINFKGNSQKKSTVFIHLFFLPWGLIWHDKYFIYVFLIVESCRYQSLSRTPPPTPSPFSSCILPSYISPSHQHATSHSILLVAVSSIVCVTCTHTNFFISLLAFGCFVNFLCCINALIYMLFNCFSLPCSDNTSSNQPLSLLYISSEEILPPLQTFLLSLTRRHLVQPI